MIRIMYGLLAIVAGFAILIMVQTRQISRGQQREEKLQRNFDDEVKNFDALQKAFNSEEEAFNRMSNTNKSLMKTNDKCVESLNEAASFIRRMR